MEGYGQVKIDNDTSFPVPISTRMQLNVLFTVDAIRTSTSVLRPLY